MTKLPPKNLSEAAEMIEVLDDRVHELNTEVERLTRTVSYLVRLVLGDGESASMSDS